jgi:hypothetical protein
MLLVAATRLSKCSGVLAVICAAQLATPAGSVAAPEAKPDVDPNAMKTLSRTVSYLRSLPAFVLRADVTQDEVVAADYKVERTGTVALTVRRPNRLRADITGDRGARTFVYDGKNLNAFLADENYYGSFPAPPTILETIDAIERYGVELPLVDLMFVAMGGSLDPTIREAGVIGPTAIMGVKCTQLAFRGDLVDWQLWVTEGDKPLPRKLVITTRDQTARPQYSAILRWDVSTPIADADFAFTPPANASRLTFAGVLPERKGHAD